MKKYIKRSANEVLATSFAAICGLNGLTVGTYAIINGISGIKQNNNSIDSNTYKAEEDTTYDSLSNKEFLAYLKVEMNKNTDLQDIILKYKIPYEDFVLEYGDYLNKTAIINTIKDLKVGETEEFDEKDVAGKYNYLYDDGTMKITMLDTVKNDYDNYRRVFTHEFFHYLLISNGKRYDNKYPMLKESFNEIITEEALNNDNKRSYEYGMLYGRVLLELISKDACINLAEGNSKLALSELSNYLGDYADTFLKNINDDIKSVTKEKDDTVEKLERRKSIINDVSKVYKEKENTDDIDNPYLISLIDSITNYSDCDHIYYTRKHFLNEDENYYYFDIKLDYDALITIEDGGCYESDIPSYESVKTK